MAMLIVCWLLIGCWLGAAPPAAASCEWSSWSPCSEECTRLRRCACGWGYGGRADGCSENSEQTESCQSNYAVCVLSSPTFIVMVFSVSVLIVGVVVVVCVRSCCRGAASGARRGSSQQQSSLQATCAGEGNGSFEPDRPPAYHECVLPADGGQACDTLPPAYEEAVANIKRQMARTQSRTEAADADADDGEKDATPGTSTSPTGGGCFDNAACTSASVEQPEQRV